MYESLITRFVNDALTQITRDEENNLIHEVQQVVGYCIDKEELIKALRYDRDQYQKGYEDGRKDNEFIPVSERLPENPTNGDMIKAVFPNFEEDVTIVGDTILLERYMPYCKMQFHRDWWDAPYRG